MATQPARPLADAAARRTLDAEHASERRCVSSIARARRGLPSIGAEVRPFG